MRSERSGCGFLHLSCNEELFSNLFFVVVVIQNLTQIPSLAEAPKFILELSSCAAAQVGSDAVPAISRLFIGL